MRLQPRLPHVAQRLGIGHHLGVSDQGNAVVSIVERGSRPHIAPDVSDFLRIDSRSEPYRQRIVRPERLYRNGTREPLSVDRSERNGLATFQQFAGFLNDSFHKQSRFVGLRSAAGPSVADRPGNARCGGQPDPIG